MGGKRVRTPPRKEKLAAKKSMMSAVAFGPWRKRACSRLMCGTWPCTWNNWVWEMQQVRKQTFFYLPPICFPCETELMLLENVWRTYLNYRICLVWTKKSFAWGGENNKRTKVFVVVRTSEWSTSANRKLSAWTARCWIRDCSFYTVGGAGFCSAVADVRKEIRIETTVFIRWNYGVSSFLSTRLGFFPNSIR